MQEDEIYDLLEQHGIVACRRKTFDHSEKMDVAFYPIALKIMSSKVVHKTEVGAVVLNIHNKEELQKAKETILANLKNHGISMDECDRFLVTEMCQGIELFFGIVNDPVFEKIIVFGAGGVFAELFEDVCFIDSEASDIEILNAIKQTKIGTLFTKGFRGKLYDAQLVINLIKKLQQIDVEEMDLNPVLLSDDSLTVVDARLLPYRAKNVCKPIKCLPDIFSVQKVAIIGVSRHIEKIGYALAKNTASNPDVFFVNPHIPNLLGKKVFNCIEQLPPVDTAVLAIPPAVLSESVEKLAAKAVKNIVIITAGFKETGKDESFIKELAERYHLNIIGPNCLGIFVNGINLTFGTGDIKTGKVNLFSQSGAIIAELMDKAAFKKIGFENIVSVGNMADVDFADLIYSYSGDNPINLYVEGIANGKNLLRAIRNSRSKIRIFKSGRCEVAKKAAFSHTGNMAGNYKMFVGLLQSVGAYFLRDINGLLYPYQFERILVITNAGGAGTVISDLISTKLYQLKDDEIERLNAVLPPHWSKNNPVDIIGDACRDRYLGTLKIADDFNADAIFVVVTPQFMTNPEEICKIFTEYHFKTSIFPVLIGGEMIESAKEYLEKNKILFFEELSEAVSFL